MFDGLQEMAEYQQLFPSKAKHLYNKESKELPKDPSNQAYRE